ncbi:MAG: hypothetical protein ACI4T9_04790 [Prevotella sp.]
MRRILFLFLFTTLTIGSFAQRKKPIGMKTKEPQEVSAQGMKLFKTMLPATAKVMFIDSVVVPKSDFLRHVPLSKESGVIRTSDAHADFPNQMGLYENELGLRRIYAKGDSAQSALYTQNKLGDNWGGEAQITDFDQAQYSHQNYPFLASDGVTLYFSAEGSESMGGRDIFMSSFDSDKASWYKPQNMGLPFNSTANDYLLAIDDLDSLGWLVTDRRQPKGKVCIYTFVPTETRQNFNSDNLDDKQLLSYARLTSIKSTWHFGDREAALKRLEALKKRNQEKENNGTAMSFVVNDHTVITSPSQFKSNRSRQLYKQLVELRQMEASLQTTLAAKRKAYHNGDKTTANYILKAEEQLEQYRHDITDTEKNIRLAELQ